MCQDLGYLGAKSRGRMFSSSESAELGIGRDGEALRTASLREMVAWWCSLRIYSSAG